MLASLREVAAATVIATITGVASLGCDQDLRHGAPAQESAPASVEQAVVQLDLILPADRKAHIRSLGERELATEHFGLGALVRNRWLYRPASPLRAYFQAAGIDHADNMSAVVVKSYWLHLQHRPFDADQLTKELLESVRRAGDPFNTQCPDAPDTKLELIFGEVNQASGGGIESQTWYADCPATETAWVLEFGSDRWRPATKIESQAIRTHMRVNMGEESQ